MTEVSSLLCSVSFAGEVWATLSCSAGASSPASATPDACASTAVGCSDSVMATLSVEASIFAVSGGVSAAPASLIATLAPGAVSAVASSAGSDAAAASGSSGTAGGGVMRRQALS